MLNKHSENTWSGGYVSDLTYTYGYYDELNPNRASFALLAAGLQSRDILSGCELGYGHGLSINIHASASPCIWWGTDFNPSQAAVASKIASESQARCFVFDQSFEDFSKREDTPEFDFIGLHGIWSWISDRNRSVIVDFVSRRLKVGGVLYISYNTFPGWAAFAPLRHLMTEHVSSLGAEGSGVISRINEALEFTDKLLQTQPLFLHATPIAKERFSKLGEQNRHYLAHEYFNRDWNPMHFATVAEWLAPAKLQYACSANLLDGIDALNLTPQQQTFLAAIPDPKFRETVRDFMVNQQFRRDYWIKGARRLSGYEQAKAFRELKVLLVTPSNDVSLKVTGSLGEATLNESVYIPILNALKNQDLISLADIEQKVDQSEVNFPQLLQAITVLIGAGHVVPVQSKESSVFSRQTSDRLNAYLLEQSKGTDDLAYLASPVTGGGVPVNRFEQLFLLAYSQGKQLPGDWAKFVWDTLAPQGQRLLKDGKALETPEENLQELQTQATAFHAKRLPTLKALGIVN